MINRDECRKIGYVYKTHGVEGDVLLASEVEDIKTIIEKGQLFIEIDGYLVPFFIESFREKNSNTFIVKFFDITNLDLAEQLIDKIILTSYKEEIIEDDLSEFSELIGFTIKDQTSSNEGEIVDYIDFSGNTNFIIKMDRKEFFIPANEDFIESIDIEKKIVLMNLPEGIFDLN